MEIIWRLDNLHEIGGHWVATTGCPRVVHRDNGTVVQFNGQTDGLLLFANPLAGLEQFTIEVVFFPDADGPEEQRFLHFEEHDTRNRIMLELRMLGNGHWSLDTFVRAAQASFTLFERQRSHPAGEWYAVALTYTGRTMTQYVNGVAEASGEVLFRPLRPGLTSIGVRQNQVSWFKGAIRLIRITPRVLSAEQLLGPTAVLAPEPPR